MFKISQCVRPLALFLGFVFLLLILGFLPAQNILSPLSNGPEKSRARQNEVFGFAPYWTIDKLGNVDFDTLTTLAYFGVPVKPNGELDREGAGYKTFRSPRATELFNKAHSHSTKVVLTITQMDNGSIEKLLENPEALQTAIEEVAQEVEKRGIDGVNVDFEYVGNPQDRFKNRFTSFVENLAHAMKKRNPSNFITVSVYAGSLLEPKLYDIEKLSKVSDGIFMMAYDYAAYHAANAIPTSPLYGYKEGKYWYDVSTAVEDFLKVMDSKKLILGVPWYGYDYPVYEPGIQTATHKGYSYSYKVKYKKRGKAYVTWKRAYFKPDVNVQTYASSRDQIGIFTANISDYQEGWDDVGKVGWKAYKQKGENFWRMLFVEDSQSLSYKYDFAKEKKLRGVGIWALGFDDGKSELWHQLMSKFGKKLTDYMLVRRAIANEYD